MFLHSNPCNIHITPSKSILVSGTSKMPLTVMDTLLNTPLKLLSSEPNKSNFFSCSAEDRLETAYDILAPYYAEHLPSAWPRTFRQKSNEKSSKYRTAGNNMFSRSKLREAIRLYNEAIFWVEPDTEELGMAFANR